MSNLRLLHARGGFNCWWRSTTWWRHQMQTFSALLALCGGNSPIIGEFPRKGQWRGALIFSLICAWTNGWANHWDASDLRRHRAHYSITVMKVAKITKVTRYIISICSWSKWSHLRRVQQGTYFMWSVEHWSPFWIMDHLLYIRR